MIREATHSDIDVLVKMGLDLWPTETKESLQQLFSELLTRPDKNQVYVFVKDEPIGFIFMSIRTDYVEGSDSSPVGYLEGIYVRPDSRRLGVSSQLLKAGERWAKSKRCSEVGSDILIENTVSYEFHKAIGFREAERLITFIKKIE